MEITFNFVKHIIVNGNSNQVHDYEPGQLWEIKSFWVGLRDDLLYFVQDVLFPAFTYVVIINFDLIIREGEKICKELGVPAQAVHYILNEKLNWDHHLDKTVDVLFPVYKVYANFNNNQKFKNVQAIEKYKEEWLVQEGPWV